MIKEYVNKLVENLPENMKDSKNPLKLDLVLDGGIFNGSYLVGCLYFLKELEKRNYIVIERISGCSVGSIVAFLYYIDQLDMMTILYEIVNKEFKETYSLNTIKNLRNHLGDKIPNDICNKINNKLYITYYNLKKKIKSIKSVYKDIDEIISTIIKSCYIPYLIDGNLLYENKYMDGMNPFIFKQESNKKILYLDLFGYDKIGYLINIKNEKTNFHRILSGLLDIHSFYIKQSNTHMCSYVNDWNITNYSYNYIKVFIEKLCILSMYFLLYVKKYVSESYKETILFKIFSKIAKDIFIILLETYCI
jgi:hypothetical protein